MKALAPLLHKLLCCVKFCMNRVDFGGQGWRHRKCRKSRASRAASDAKRCFVQVQAMKAAVPKWAMPVRAMIKHFRHEFEHHIEHKTCMVPAYV